MHTSNLFNNPLSDLATASVQFASTIKNKLSMMSNHNSSIPPSNAARRCLFGPPDPKSIETMFNSCNAISQIRAIRNYGFDTRKDQFVDRNDLNAYENALNVLKENCANGLIDQTRIDRIHSNYDNLFSNISDMQKIDLIVNHDQLLTDTYSNGSNGYIIGLDGDDREEAIEISEKLKFQLENSHNNNHTSNRSVIIQRCVDYRNKTAARKDRRDTKSSPYSRTNKDTNKITDKYQQDNLQSPPTKKSKDDHTE